MLVISEKNASHSAFAILQGESSDQSSQKEGEKSKKIDKSKKKCFCGFLHVWFKCYYLVSTNRSADWSSNSEIEKKITHNMKKSSNFIKAIQTVRRRVKKKAKKFQNFEKDKTSIITFQKESLSSTKSFAALSAFFVSQQSYKLINSWILNEENDTHVCNNPQRFTMKRMTSEENIIIVEKTIHQIETFETVDIVVKNPRGLISIRLLNVALIIDYFINLICLDKFEEKGIYHDFEHERLQRKNETFCYVERVGRHKMIEYNALEKTKAVETFEAFVFSSRLSQILKTIEAEWHNILAHSGSETLFNLKKTTDNIRVIASKSTPAINQCEICALIKAHKFISRRPGHEESADASFERIGFDLISQHQSYNGDNWVNHFTCFHIKMEFVFTHVRKNDALKMIKAFFQMMRTRYDQIVRFFRMNDKQTLNDQFDEFMKMYGILQKRTAPYTANQNGKTEKFEKVLIIRTKTVRIANHFSIDMWPEIYKAVEYFNNRTSRKNLK